MNTNIIEFPNLGLGPWEINKFAVHVGNFRVAWYGIIITLGIFAAVWYAMHRTKKSEKTFTQDDVLDYALWTVIIGILGARLYYVIMTWGSYDNFLEIFAIWNGGLAIYGGLIAGGLTILVVSLYKHKNPLTFLDIVAPGVMLAQAIGRWGNFVNAEAYGSILKYEFLGHTFELHRFEGMAVPWIMTVKQVASDIPHYAHPTFLYESLWNVIGFIIINIIYNKKKKFDGQIFFSYIIWYGFGRMFIEGMREDSLRLGNVRISQLVALGCVLFGILFYALLAKRAKPVLAAKADKQAYQNLFSDKPAKKAKKAESEEYVSMFAPAPEEKKEETQAEVKEEQKEEPKEEPAEETK